MTPALIFHQLLLIRDRFRSRGMFIALFVVPVTLLATETPGLDLELKSVGLNWTQSIDDHMMGNQMSFYGKFKLKEGVRGRLSWRRRDPFNGQSKNSVTFGLEVDTD
jgi:hypothetical protein